MSKVRSERTNDLWVDDDGLGPPTSEGQIRHDAGDLKGYFGGQVVSLLAGGSGLTPGSHRALDQLVHELAEDAYTEITRTAGQVTNVTTWTDSGKTVKIRESQITRTAGQVSQTVDIQYDAVGTEVERMTRTYNRTSGQVTSIDEVLT
jgi:hypothetical protein